MATIALNPTTETDACCGEKRCGENRPETAGQPLIPACQLCPKSPTYWRKSRTAEVVSE